MAEFRYGPVELYLVGFEGEHLDPASVSALLELIETGQVRLLDLVFVSKSESGEVTVTEVEQDLDAHGLGGVELAATGIAGEADIDEFAALIDPGTSAALVALELTYARELARALNASGSVVLRTERIPAPVVNAVLDVLENE